MVYRSYLQMFSPDAKIWGDKNPSYLRHIDKILQDFPEARIVHIIRDIRSIYASLNAIYQDEISRAHWSKMQTPLPHATHQWDLVYEVFEKQKKNPRLYTLFYERLVSEPESTLNSLCSFLAIPFHDSMLDFHRHNKQKQLVANFVLRWEQKTLEAVDQSRVNSWKNELKTAQIHAIEMLNRKKIRKMGYQPMTWGVNPIAFIQILREYLPLFKKRWKKYLFRSLSISRHVR